MSDHQATVLGGRSVIAVSGPEARDFLQGLVTSDVETLAEGTARNAALLTPQGKILFEFMIFRAGADQFLLDCPADSVAELAKRLTFYKLRAKVEIAAQPDMAVVALWDSDAQPHPSAFADPRLAALGWRALLPASEAQTVAGQGGSASEADYHARRIALGVAELGADYASSAAFPHEANLDQLGGVDFKKGCYVGQEVVSRMQHRGTARSRFVPVAISGAAPDAGPTVEAGTTVEAGGKAVGTMGSSAGDTGLALLRLDRIGDAVAAGNAITAGDATLTPRKPDWAGFDWPAGDQEAGEHQAGARPGATS
ncbi:CAF17-like 4Fe-4S cluster assembly/insertion protein YgfZ [Microbaculum sp. FT89]|uniref:CAF17-like 4Fe-4S cluster assembly/insertion protein YgfZ n=1 Tax=Microbaculum sp. FT89 TaxID=3447298 RepID=UPI003F530E66